MIAMHMTAHDTLDLSKRLTDAVQRLMTVRHDDHAFRISVPILYPSGSGCAVEVTANGENIFVSDIGIGHMEAEYAGASEIYVKEAGKAADRYGVRFDGYSIFNLRTSIDRIEGAIVAVSNASVQAASAAILRSAENKDRNSNNDVFDRLMSIFSTHLLVRTADIKGQRDTWPAHNVVIFPTGQKAVFEFVNPHQNSISSKFLMFSDLLASGATLALNTVTEDISKLGSRGAMLSDVSNMIELSAEDAEFEKYARLTIAA
jgi:hypothetical protein